MIQNTTIQLPPKHVGGYSFSGITFYLTEKPKWFHRKMMKVFFGWEWRDVQN